MHFSLSNARVATLTLVSSSSLASCDYKGKSSSHVDRHRLVHTGNFPFKCDFPGCGEKFKHIAPLQRHVERHSA